MFLFGELVGAFYWEMFLLEETIGKFAVCKRIPVVVAIGKLAGLVQELIVARRKLVRLAVMRVAIAAKVMPTCVVLLGRWRALKDGGRWLSRMEENEVEEGGGRTKRSWKRVGRLGERERQKMKEDLKGEEEASAEEEEEEDGRSVVDEKSSGNVAVGKGKQGRREEEGVEHGRTETEKQKKKERQTLTGNGNLGS
ncbi:hypothetical protein WH47_05509 [Habropoda laboriosa]|uniref:Uncharacterized protein n=1 Tax=Habropoda laboriosa TaxID=597456 RepID=A0A0L7RFS2_9HYME|nr:hypothetical protein WH47_05509 [Habropoda laboriosa]